MSQKKLNRNNKKNTKTIKKKIKQVSKNKQPKKIIPNKNSKSELLFRTKLDTLITNIDSLQKLSGDSDIKKTQDIIKYIVDDIVLFLKILPEIRDANLLTAFNKAYRKIERFIKSVNLNIKNIDSINKGNNNSNISHNNIMLEKVKDNTSVYFRVKLNEDGNTIVKLYSEDFTLMRKYIVIPIENQEKRINNFTVEFESDIYNDNDYTILETIIDGNRQNNKLTGNQGNIFYNIFMDINSNNSSANNVKNITNNNNIEDIDKIDNADNEMLFLDVAFPKNEKSILVSPSKVGKSFISIEVGSSEKIKHPLYIFVDDQDSPQLQRYKNKLGDKATIIDYNMFNEKREELKKEYKKKKNMKLLFEQMIQYSDKYNKIEKNIFKLLFDNWVIDNESKHNSFEVDIIEYIVKSVAEEKEIDFICIDSLSAIFGVSQRLKRAYIDSIIKIANRHKASLLIIHHTTGDDITMQNKSAISGSFDNEYLLSHEKSIDNINILKLIGISRYSGRKSFMIKQIFEDKHTCNYEIIKDATENYANSDSFKNKKSKDKNLTWKIEQIIKNHKEKRITLKELHIQIKKQYGLTPNEVSIKNILKNIKQACKTDGKWNIITIKK